MSEGPLIEVRDLRKTFYVKGVKVLALQGLDLEVAKGEFVGIMGPSGSGKSTLFNIIGGLTRPTSGAVRIEGKALAELSDAQVTELRKRTVGLIFQKCNLLPTLTAEDNIRLARYIGKGDVEFDDRLREVLSILGITNRLAHRPRALSGGERQRVAIARAIVNGPSILLADEPTGNLDTVNATSVLALLRDLNKQRGQTILMISHARESLAYISRVLQMRDGCLVDV